ncbi:MAG: polyhydroxyalkanoate synthesis regulator DNA-binding domain-containing protein [Planctomycetota bacterium]|jgi:polyhydroxyalkanoate synthesis repressor PhaR
MVEARLIKRYANRKLYDTHDKRYVTLEQIAQLVRDGEEIKVIDNESTKDLTSVTLSQILVEQERKREGGLPKNFLTELVKSSSTLFDYLRKTLTSWLQAVHLSEAEIDSQMQELVQKGHVSVDEAKKLKKDIVDRTRAYMSRVDSTIDERVSSVLGRLKIPTHRDVEALTEQVGALQSRIDELLTKLDEKAGKKA